MAIKTGLTTAEMIVQLEPGQRAIPEGYTDDYVMIEDSFCGYDSPFVWQNGRELFGINDTTRRHTWTIE